MQIHPLSLRRNESGYVLIVVLLSLAILLVVFVSMMGWSSSNARIVLRNNLFNQSEAAAEAATENILATMMRDFFYQSLNLSPSYYNGNFPATNGWPVYFQFSDTNGNTAYAATVTIGSYSTSATNLNSQFTDLTGFVLPCEIASTARPMGQGQNLSATVYQSIQFALVPVFQFAIFYNMDLEINPGAAMNINGHVHSNNSIWATGSSAGSPLTFAGRVDASGTITNRPSSLDPQNTARSGNVVYTITDNNPVANSDSLTLPLGTSTNNNPTNVLAILLNPPSTYAPPNYSAAYSTNGMIYLENAVDLIISNSPAGLAGTRGTNLTVYYQNPNNPASYITPVPPDVMISSNVTGSGSSKTTNLLFAYSFVTNVAFTDLRESDVAQAVQIDVQKLNTWLTNTATRGGNTYSQKNIAGSTSKGHAINSIYVDNNVANSSGQLPAVRMVNGQQLPPAGLSVITANPLYVQGDYNVTDDGVNFSRALGDTTNTLPAALMADAITVLSGSWNDANSSSSLGSRNASSTTVNAATLEGIVPSNGAHYSGGVENFIRLLEDWSGDTLTYNGSIVVMFPSQYATGFWQTTGNYYNAPTRKWGFDLNFMQASKQPPLTPNMHLVLRGNWAAW
jgi:hypothetical protein